MLHAEPVSARLRARATRSSLRRRLVALGVVALAGAACTSEPPASFGTGPSYVALGDSWVGAPLISAPSTAPIGCVRSTTNYPAQVAARIQARRFVDVSCGDATIADLTKTQKLAPIGIQLGTAPPQFDALSPDTDLVTIGIGGNTAGLPGFGVGCVTLVQIPIGPAPFGRSCQERYVHDGIDEASVATEKMADEAAVAFAELRQRAPNATVFVVGYPTAFPPGGTGCSALWPILDVDAAWLSDKMDEMNDALETAALQQGFRFVDLRPSTRGHDGCKPNGTAWVNGLTFAPDGFPLHPNSMGATNAAKVTATAIENHLALRRG